MPSKPPVPKSKTSSTDPEDSVQGLAKKLLEAALSLHADGKSLSCPEIDGPIASLCSRARSDGMSAEKLIISLKQSWHTAAGASAHDNGEVVSRIVSLCIVEFYKDEN